jgi:hypothetical protein
LIERRHKNAQRVAVEPLKEKQFFINNLMIGSSDGCILPIVKRRRLVGVYADQAFGKAFHHAEIS